MKRIQSACICQTLHFLQKDALTPELTAKLAREELDAYKHRLDSSNTRYKILEEIAQADGSIVIRIIKQYNHSPVGDYLNN